MNTIRATHTQSFAAFTVETISIINKYFANPIITTLPSMNVDKVSKTLSKYSNAVKFNLDTTELFLIKEDDKDIGIITIQTNDNVVIVIGDSLLNCQKIYNLVKEFKLEYKENNASIFNIYYLDKDNGLYTIQIVVHHKQLNCIKPELYPDINPETLAKEFIKSDDNLLIIHGDPGTGKTSFIKYLVLQLYKLENTNEIGYAKDWKTMNDPQFWPKITDHNPELLILDDLDHDLTSKDSNRSPFVSNLLSYLDGVLTNKSNKVIISTNQPIGTIDPALLRSGRCFDCLELHKLEIEYARQLWQEMNLTVKFPFTKSLISQAEFMSVINNLTQKKKTREYIKKGPAYSSIEEKLGL